MRYALGQLRQPGGRLIAELDDPLPPGTGVREAGPVTGRLELAHGGSSISARGWLRVPIRLECDRCLADFDTVLELDVNEECALAELDVPEAALIAAGQAGQIPILNDDDVDLSELVRQLVAMNLPTRALCREDCAGLCAQCGHDLNQGPCRCHKPPTDPRWGALGSLKL